MNLKPVVARPISPDKAMLRLAVFIIILIVAPAGGAKILLAQSNQIEADYLQRLRSTPIGRHQLADLNMPADLERRVADRLLCDSFERQFRIVVRDENISPPPAATTPTKQQHERSFSLAPARFLTLGGILLIVSLLTAMLARPKKVRP
jgi:hypothetical protein